MDAGIAADEAAVDVDLYARTLLGWDRTRLLIELTNPVPHDLEPRLTEWLLRRVTREPSAYIVGTREFWGLDFRVSPDVLIPRPESELIVEEALAFVRTLEAPRIADVGTGSGCLAVSLARELPGASIVATDISREALVVAGRNAIHHAVYERIQLVQTSYLDDVEGDFDLVVANPPYVRDGDKPALARDVRHEPDVALFGGADGLRDIAGVLDAARTRIRPGGRLITEFGYGQEDDVRALVATRPELSVVHVREDLQGIARTAVIARRVHA